MNRMREDIRTVFAEDPAAHGFLEVLVCYPGLHALWLHRISCWLWRHNLPFFARLLSHFGRLLTGIEIHPGATIGRRFFIDHGMGVVIGETSEIGEDVLMYQGVVLGGTSLEKAKRHPTIGNKVVLGTGCIVLGPIVVGDGARIGAGSVVVRDVPAGATVVGVPGRVGMGFTSEEVAMLEHGKLPDPIADAVRFVMDSNERMELRVAQLEGLSGVEPPEESDAAEKEQMIKETFSSGAGI